MKKKVGTIGLFILCSVLLVTNVGSIYAKSDANQTHDIEYPIIVEPTIGNEINEELSLGSSVYSRSSKIELKSESMSRTEDIVHLNVADGCIYIEDDGYWFGEKDNLIFKQHTGKYFITGTFIADKTISGNQLIITPRITIQGGSEGSPIEVVLENVKIDNGVHNYGDYYGTDASAIKIGKYSPWTSGHAKIILEGQNTIIGNDGSAGIEVDSIKQGENALSSLVIEGDGSLVAKSTGGGAGIGNGQQKATHLYPKITINSGTIIAQGGQSAAGIGGGKAGNGGEIIINGGNITATGGLNGAGIGGGWQPNITDLAPGNIDIAINGGTVHAIGGNASSGIGTGYYQTYGAADLENLPADVSIKIGGDANVTAVGGDYGSGIGSGHTKSDINDNAWRVSTIDISGGTVAARGGIQAPAIGAGLRNNISSIHISGGDVKAGATDYGAAIGTSWTSATDKIASSVDEICITGGNITANSAKYGAGIGTGYSTTGGLSKVNTIMISNGFIEVNSQYAGAGIGSGMIGATTAANQASIDKIDIKGGTIHVNAGDFGAGIGSGSAAFVNVIRLSNGIFDITGGIHGAGIGAGQRGAVGQIQLMGGTIDVDSNYVMSDAGVTGNGAAVGTGLDGKAESIIIGGSTVLHATAAPFAAAIGRGYHRADVNNPVIPITITDNPTIEAYAVGSPISVNPDETNDFMQAIDYEGLTGTSRNILMGHFKDNFATDDVTENYKNFKVTDSQNMEYELSIPVMFQSFAITTDYDGVHKVTVDGNLFAGNIEKNETQLTTKLEVNHQQFNPHWFLQPIESYTVDFESNGGSKVDSMVTGKDETIDEPNSPTKEQAVFLGWYKDEDFTNKWDFKKDVVTKNMTLYAKWEMNKYTVDYKFTSDENPSDVTVPKNVNIEYGTTIEEPNFTIPDHWEFDGWYLDETHTQKFDFSTVITDDLTLYGYWSFTEPVKPSEPIDSRPSTSDSTNVSLYLLLLGASVLLVYKVKRKENEK